MAPVAVSTEEFLKAIWGTDDKGIAELTVIHPKGFIQAHPFTWPDSIDGYAFAAKKHNQISNVFYGVLLRGKPWPYKTGRRNADGTPEEAKRGREDNVISGSVVWCEFDFYTPAGTQGHKGRVCLPEDAQRFLSQFPLKPSIVLKSGGGIHVFYLLKEAVTGDEVWRIKSVNKALCEHFTVDRDGKKYGADTQAIDLARVLRLPNSVNHKYSPPRPAEITYWQPDRRYTLDDFDFLPQEDMKPRAVGAPGSYASAGNLAPGVGRPAPVIRLDDAKIIELTKLFSEIWSPADGLRHEMAFKAAGWLAFSGIHMDTARAIIGGASDSVGGDTKDRLTCVDTTYNRFVQGEEVAGRPLFEKLINEAFPPVSRPSAKKVIEKIEALLPKRRADDFAGGPPGGDPGGGGGDSGMRGPGRPSTQGAEPDFDITKIIKFNSRPARYKVIVRKHGESTDYEIPCEIEVYANIKKFRIAFLEHTENKFIANIKQHRWERLVSSAKLEIQEAPEEATGNGAIRAKLENFLEEKKENPELGELKSFPGYNDDEIFFQLDAFRRRLRDAGIKVSDREIVHVLRDQGWSDDRRWISNKNPRLWVKAILKGGGTNGNGNGDGHGGPPGPKPPDEPLPPELFPPSDDLSAPPADGGTGGSPAPEEATAPSGGLPDAHEPVERQPGEDTEEVSPQDAGAAE